VALYLAAAGVGHLGVVDFDVVEASNLQRQILHRSDELGRSKATSAEERIRQLNPDVTVVAHQTRLTAANVLDIADGYDVIVDATDNFPTRYLLNDASLHLRTPVVHGSIFRFEGQASVFDPYQGPCYRCLFPVPPPPDLAPSCAVAGVVGALPGVIGSIQAMETLKALLGKGVSLVGKLLIYDGLEQDMQTVTVKRRSTCAACGDPTSPPPLIDYDQHCLPAPGRVARS
jgi:molybdopterin/thiamine biosynthesis adenylyltransferase